MGRPDKAFEDVLRQNLVRPYRAEAYRLMGRILETKAAAAANAGNTKAVAEFLKAAARAYGDAANRDARDAVSRQKLMELRPAQ
jgi:hypothetical protein